MTPCYHSMWLTSHMLSHRHYQVHYEKGFANCNCNCNFVIGRSLEGWQFGTGQRPKVYQNSERSIYGSFTGRECSMLTTEGKKYSFDRFKATLRIIVQLFSKKNGTIGQAVSLFSSKTANVCFRKIRMITILNP